MAEIARFAVLFAGVVSAQGPPIPKPQPEHKKLHCVVGEWRSEGEMKGGITAMAEGEFEKQCVVMGHFIENAKAYVQLSAGALVLTVTFLHEVVGIPKGERVGIDWYLIASWVCFLVAVLSGALYQYLAVKFLEWKSGVGRHYYKWLEPLIESPGNVYGAMLMSFYAGGVFFLLEAIRRL